MLVIDPYCVLGWCQLQLKSVHTAVVCLLRTTRRGTWCIGECTFFEPTSRTERATAGLPLMC